MEGITKRTRQVMVVLISALVGVAVFLSLYGGHVLNPAYTDWLMDGGSLSKGYLGWRLFQSADWQFPPGAMASLGYPQQISVAATDAVPLLAVIGKLLSSLYDGSFQYFGWWGLVCFLLQGLFGGLLCLRITRSSWQAVLGSFLFILSPVLWQNTFFSAGMAGHWVLLAALLPLVYRQPLANRSRLPFILWGGLGVVSIGIHGQLALICGIFCVGYCIYSVLESKQWEKILPFVVFLLVVLTVGWMLGTFTENGMGGIRLFGISLSALWDPHNYARALKNLSNPGDYQYAGFAYVGFGMLALCALALIWLVKPYFSRGNIGRALMDDMRTHGADVAAFAFIALSCIALGLAQPVVYLAMTLVFSVLAHRMSKKLLSALLACCLCLQAYDASIIFQVRRMHYNQTVQAEQTTNMDEWAILAQGNLWSAVVISPAVLQSVHLAPLVEAVRESGQTLNTLSFANDSSYRHWENAINAPEDDVIFVFTAEELLKDDHFQIAFAHIDYLYQWNDLVVGFAKPTLLPFPQILSRNDIAFRYRYPIGENEHLRSGEDIGGTRYIYPGGLSYGPYLSLETGTYELRVAGERLDEATFSFTASEGEVDPSEVLSSPTERVYRLDAPETVSDLEILIGNGTSSILLLNAMTVTQLD